MVRPWERQTALSVDQVLVLDGSLNQAGDEVDRARDYRHAKQVRQQSLGQHGSRDPAIAHRGVGHPVARADREGEVSKVAVSGLLRPSAVAEGNARVPRANGGSASRE